MSTADPGARPARGFWVVAAAFLVTMIGTTLPTPLYPVYEADFGWSRLTVTVVFATYAVGVLTALVLFGDLSDRAGRIRTLLPGLAAAGLSAACFLVATDLGVVLVGRFLSGLSAGVFTGTATATLIDLTPPGGRQRAALVATVVNMGGLGLGPPLAGIVADLLPHPLRTVYLLHLVLVGLVGLALSRVREPTSARGGYAVRARGLTVPASTRAEFVRASVAGFAGFAVLGLFTAITPSLLGEVVGVTDHAAVGAVVMTMFVGSIAGQLLRRRVADRVALAGGCAVLIAGMALLVVAVHTGSLVALVATALVSGAGQGLSFAAALGLVATEAPRRPAGRRHLEPVPRGVRRDLAAGGRCRPARPGHRAGRHRHRLRRRRRRPRRRGRGLARGGAKGVTNPAYQLLAGCRGGCEAASAAADSRSRLAGVEVRRRRRRPSPRWS